ncbi:MAG TPA: glycosyltransferase [Thermoanaerobaculia bacterium]|nr:glycosyltransferase [Thermoanaerobaculia bacterium]
MSSPGPRVALIHDWLTGMRGGEKVLEEIADLFPEAPIYTLLHVAGSVSERLERHEIRTSFLQRAPFVERRYRHYLPLFPAAVESFDLSGFDLVISTSHCVAKGVIPAPHALHVCYCHTPMRYAWDQEAEYFPKRTGLIARLRGAALSRLRTWDVASTVRVDELIANSSFVRQRIRRYYGREAHVLAPPVDVDYFSERPERSMSSEPGDRPDPSAAVLSPPYLLSVAALSPYKRHDLAIEAARRSGIALKIVGEGPDRERLEALAGPGVELVGRVGGDELRRLYQGALALVQPGIEDFGIAAVEALAAGTPVIAAGAGGVCDVVEDRRHGLLYDPRSGLAGLLRAIDKRQQLGFNPLDLETRAGQFSRERFREGFRALLESRVPGISPLGSIASR